MSPAVGAVSGERTETLRRAEAWLRQGRLDEAIGAYARALESQPDDWSTARVLGDLYVRAGQAERGIAQFLRIGAHLAEAGFFPKAAALYKKILKIDAGCEEAAQQLAEVCAAQGLLVDARSQLAELERRRRARGDEAGADEITRRLASLHGVDLARQIEAARLMAAAGDTAGAKAHLKNLATTFSAPGQREDRQRLNEAMLGLSPADLDLRRRIALDAALAGDAGGVDRVLALGDPPRDVAHLRLALDANLGLGRVSEVRVAATRLAAAAGGFDEVLDAIAGAGEVETSVLFPAVEAAVEAAVGSGSPELAVAALDRFVARHPAHPPALLRLTTLLPVDGDPNRKAAVARALASAYLDRQMPSDARGVLDRVLENDPADLEALALIERALRELGDLPAADAAAVRLAAARGSASEAPADATGSLSAPDTPAEDAEAADDAEPEEDLDPDAESDDDETGDETDDEIEGAEGAVSSPPLDVVGQDDDRYVLDRETFDFTALTAAEGEDGEPVEIDLTLELEHLGNPPGRPDAAAPAKAAPAEAPTLAGATATPAPPEMENTDPDDQPHPADGNAAPSDVRRQVAGLSTAESGPRERSTTAADGSLQAIFQAIRDRLGPDEVAEHRYWQGVACRGAGLDEAANAAFVEAGRDPQVMVQAALALGEMAEERGQLEEASGWYERATSELDGDQELRWYALYRHAVTLEATGQSSRALSVLLELLAEAADYRDARARVDRLTEVETGG